MNRSMLRFSLGIVAQFMAINISAAVGDETQISEPPRPTITASGEILNEQDEPIAGADVMLRLATDAKHDVLARTTTDAEGRFSFPLVKIPLRYDQQIASLTIGNGGAEVIAYADAYGLSWQEIDRLGDNRPLRLRLPAEVNVEGRVRDEGGQPIRDVLIRITGATKQTIEIDETLRQPGDLRVFDSDLALVALTDAEGRFNLRHVPPEYCCFVLFRAADRDQQSVLLDTLAVPKTAMVRIRPAPRARPLLRSPLDVTLRSAKTLIVRVIDQDGHAVSGGTVFLHDNARHFRGSAELSADGVARLASPGGDSYELIYEADLSAPHLSAGTVVEIKDEPTTNVDIQLQRSRTLRVRVVDAESSEPIEGITIEFQPQYEPSRVGGTSRAITDESGWLALPVAIGRGNLLFVGQVYGYFAPSATNRIGARWPDGAMTPIEVPEKGEIEPVQLQLAKGLMVIGVVRDRNGKPLPGAMVSGRSSNPSRCKNSAISDTNGNYQIAGLSPYVENLVTAFGPDGVVRQAFPPDPNHKTTTTRRIDADLILNGGALRGRVLKGREPRSNVQMRLFASQGAKKNQLEMIAETRTDEQGNYRIAGLATGDHFYFEVADPEGLIASGWEYQRPYIQVFRDVGHDVELPVINLVSRGQTLSGVVVDPDGQPVADITVSAHLANGKSISYPGQGAAPWTKSDAEGRFNLVELPDEPVELMAYRAKSEGGPIAFPAKMRPQIGQQNIRIIFDPRLSDDVEDLDGGKKALGDQPE